MNNIADRYISLVCARKGITAEALKSPSREGELRDHRIIAMYILWRYAKMSYQKISDTLERKSHATSRSLILRAIGLLEFDKTFIANYNDLLKEAEQLKREIDFELSLQGDGIIDNIYFFWNDNDDLPVLDRLKNVDYEYRKAISMHYPTPFSHWQTVGIEMLPKKFTESLYLKHRRFQECCNI
jgi:hypothetical protein